jgi:hypothetical protein
MAKKRRSSASGSRKTVSNTLVRSVPLQKRQVSIGRVRRRRSGMCGACEARHLLSMGPMGHAFGAPPVLLVDKRLFTATGRAGLWNQPTMSGMESTLSTELTLIRLAVAAVFILVLVLLARLDRGS